MLRRRLIAAAWYTSMALISVIAFLVFTPLFGAGSRSGGGEWAALALPIACASMAGFAVGIPGHDAPMTPPQSVVRGGLVTLVAYILYVVLNYALDAAGAIDLQSGIGADLFTVAIILWPAVMVAGAASGWLFARLFPSSAEEESF